MGKKQQLSEWYGRPTELSGTVTRAMVSAAALAAVALMFVLSFATSASASATLEVETKPATEVTGTRARLNGVVDPKGNPAVYTFLYGKTTAYGSETKAVIVEKGSGVIQASELIQGLEPLTTYHFQIVAYNDEGFVYGKDQTFTTGDFRPVVTTDPASLVKNGSAILNGTVNPKGFGTTYQFEYGTTTSYGSKSPASPKAAGSGTSPVAVSSTITGLSSNTLYHYRLVATSAEGTTYGKDRTLEIHPPRFEASQYSVSVKGAQLSGQELRFTVQSGLKTTCTTATLAGSLKAASSSLALTPSYSGCTVFGINGAINANGCSYVVDPTAGWPDSYASTVDLSCPAGKAIEVTTATCTFTIGEQGGLGGGAQLTNGPGKWASVITAVLNVTGLDYTVVKDGIGCPLSGTGSFEGATLTGTAELEAVNGTGNERDLFVGGEEEEAHAPLFEAERYPATVAGSEVSGKALAMSLPSGLNGSCTGATFAGSLSAASSSLGLSPSYTGCTFFGLAGTINANGCSYVEHAESKSGNVYSGLLDISCPAGKAIEISTLTCTLTVGSHSGLSGASYQGVIVSGEEAFQTDLSLSGLKYTVVKDGIGCPLSGTGSFEGATLTGSATITAKDAGGKAIGVRVGG